MQKIQPRHRYKTAWKVMDRWRTMVPPPESGTIVSVELHSRRGCPAKIGEKKLPKIHGATVTWCGPRLGKVVLVQLTSGKARDVYSAMKLPEAT